MLKRSLILFFVLFVSCFFSAASGAEEKAIRVGSIGESTKLEVEKHQPLADYLAKHLAEQGITGGRVVVAESISEMSSLLKNGAVDIFIDSPYPALRVMHQSGAKPLLRRWKKGIASYYSDIFVRKDSGIEKIEDLKGKMIAFEEPFSTSGNFLPRSVLRKAGLKVTQQSSPASSVSPGEVGYALSGDDENTVVWVLRKKVAAGGIDHTKLEALAGDSFEDLKVIAHSIEVPRQVVVCRADLDPKLLAALEMVLIQMDKNGEGRAVLKAFENTTKFDPFPEGHEAALKPLEDLLAVTEENL